MPSLALRNRQPELMDQPDLDKDLHEQALRGLARINWFSRSNAILWPNIASAAKATDRTVRVLDVACGSGDVAISISRKAQKSRIPVEISGCDISETSVRLAKQNAESLGAAAKFFRADVFSDSIPDDFDVVMCSLFLHHLDEDDAIALLEQMAKATKQIVMVNDLVRSQSGYWLAYFGTRLLSRSPIVHTDGPLSVQGAYRPDEIMQLASAAGLENVQLTRHWPQRILMTWKRNP